MGKHCRRFGLSGLLLKVSRGGIVDQPAVLRKPGAMTGAVPAVLLGVPFQSTAQVGTAFWGQGQQIFCRFREIDAQLRMQHAAGGGENFRIGILLPQNQIGQKLRGHHGGNFQL